MRKKRLNAIVKHVKDARPPGREILYCGRGPNGCHINNTHYPHPGWLGNPFVMHNEGEREAVIQRFREVFNRRLANDPEFRYILSGLRKKKLVLTCWCHPLPCHADIIAEYLNS